MVPPGGAAAGSHVDDEVRVGDHVEVVLDDDDGGSLGAEAVDDAEQHANVEGCSPTSGSSRTNRCTGLLASELLRRAWSLGFAARQRRRVLTESQVAQPEVDEGLQLAVHLRQVFGDLQRLLHGERGGVQGRGRAHPARRRVGTPEVVLDDDHRGALRAQAVDDAEQDRMSSGCRPTLGSSSTNIASDWVRPSSVASLSLCASPPDSAGGPPEGQVAQPEARGSAASWCTFGQVLGDLSACFTVSASSSGSGEPSAARRMSCAAGA